ncbi:SEP-domain-containing protein [Patellaria atrata CBS 101060]|uniref:SEP-domain-containing protein n=1 Tax=Patellaria atrata CBS 101060 TaxID=1346257 RepID=A0A9P4SFE2_9PEZI|nr:SEP-domain-containing protein [Patellaria atrata CBS 101060]
MERPTTPDRDALISQFCSVTGVPPVEADNILSMSNWDVANATALYYETQESQEQAEAEEDELMEEAPSSGGGRTLGGAPAPSAAASSSSAPRAAPGPQRGLRTLRDLQGGSGSHGHAHDSDDDDDDENRQDFYTGGEKSGLAVENPGSQNAQDLVNRVLQRAQRNVERPGGDDVRPSSHFRGTGMTLGGDDAPSRAIPDPTSNQPQPSPRVHRTLHLWRDGFSVDDGELYRYDDPANAQTLQMINEGRAPLELLGVEPGQEIDVDLQAHRDQDYVKPKSKYKPFSGSGQRLGSPTPGIAASSSSQAPAPSIAPAASVPSSSSTPTVSINESEPTVTLQIRLGDGTRLSSRFNTSHTIGDVYDFINRASPASTQRGYALMTTFPSKELKDKAQKLGDMSDFKRGGVVVQKWT